MIFSDKRGIGRVPRGLCPTVLVVVYALTYFIISFPLFAGDGGPTTAVVHERSTTPIALSEIGGRWLSVSATLQEHRGTGGKQAGACPLREFSVTATLIADPH